MNTRKEKEKKKLLPEENPSGNGLNCIVNISESKMHTAIHMRY